MFGDIGLALCLVASALAYYLPLKWFRAYVTVFLIGFAMIIYQCHIDDNRLMAQCIGAGKLEYECRFYVNR
jgi:hypothetical protein